MFCTDFEYDGKRLSDYDSVLCHLTDSADLETASIGSDISFNTVMSVATNKFRKISAQYTEAYTATFQICKNPCADDIYYTEMEIKNLTRWLKRKDYRKFKLIYDSGDFCNVYYNAYFNVSAIRQDDRIIGFELTIITNAPYGFYDPIEYLFQTSGTSNSFTIYDISDEPGFSYPEIVQIECLESGNLQIDQENSDPVVINNCANGEIITLDGENKCITTSMSDTHTKLYNDFNYNFLKVHNNDDSAENLYTTSIPCNITITYSPIYKAGVI